MTEPTAVRVTDPSGILSIVPLLMGFEPSAGDVIMLGLADTGRVAVTMRFDQDIVREANADILAPVLANIQDAGVSSAFLIGYGAGQQVTPSVDKLRDLVGQELHIRDALRVEGDRYFSYTCDDLECCPAEGVQFEPESTASTTLRAEAGVSARQSRAELVASLAAPAGVQSMIAQEAWDRVRGEALSYEQARDRVVQAIADCREGKLPDAEQSAQLAASLVGIPVRDYAWSLLDPEHAEEHSGLWSAIVRNVPAEAAAAPASLLAFTSWQGGNGALANIAVDRALEAKPGYSMAQMIGQAVNAGLSPDKAVLPMTPAEVEQSYRDNGTLPRADKAQPEAEIHDYEMEAGS